jgi:hypothetical protein
VLSISSPAAVAVNALVLDHSPTIRTVEIGSEALLVDESSGRSCPLDGSAALLWACLDGESSLLEICVDVSDVLGVALERVLADAEVISRRLVDQGFAFVHGDAAHPSGGLGCAAAPACCSDHADASYRDFGAHDPRWLPELPDPCLDSHFTRGGAGEFVIRVRAGDGSIRLIGLRMNDADAAAEVRRRLGSLVAHGEVFRAPNLSVRFGSERGRVRDAHVVFRRGSRVMHTFSRAQAIDAAVGLIHTLLPGPGEVLTMYARPLQRDGSVVLVAESFAAAIDAQRRRLTAAGFTPLPYAPVRVDTAAGEALVPRGSRVDAPQFDRLRIAHVVVAGAVVDRTLSFATQVHRAKSLIRGRRHPLRAADFGKLASLLATVPIARIDTSVSSEVARFLATM